MNISSVNVLITQNDLIGAIKEIINLNDNVKGLNINKVNLQQNNMEIYGEYINKINIKFMVIVDVFDVRNNVVSLKIKKVKVFKLRIFNFIVSSILNKIMKTYEKYGVFFEKGIIQIDFDLICNYIPQVNFNVLSIDANNNCLKVELQNIDISLDSNKDKKLKFNNNESQIKIQKDIVKKYDGYTNVRQNIVKKVPDKYEKLAEYILIIPDIIALLVRILKDKRVDIKIKAFIIGMLAYLCFPVDIVPDFIPVLGQADDVAIAFFGINHIINKIPKNIILENWQGKDDIFDVVSKGVAFISNFLGKNRKINFKNMLKNGLKKKKSIKKSKK